MKVATEVSPDKLRGGFYTPAELVEVCLARVAALVGPRNRLSVLEPSVGDGAFLRRLLQHQLRWSVASFTGVEVIEEEAATCRDAGRDAPFETLIHHSSVLEWAAETNSEVDIVVGNPPFVRYQFVSKADLQHIERLGRRLNLTFRGVSNLWIPVLLGALSRLNIGGAMALVVPAELFTGLSAGDARLWLLRNIEALRIDMFAPGSFPHVLQEVVVISGRRAGQAGLDAVKRNGSGNYVDFVEHTASDETQCWRHVVPQSTHGWTRYLLTPNQLAAFDEASSLPGVQRFGSVAKLEVSIVTGANDYFSVTTEAVEQYRLHPWADPLLPRIRYAEGLIYSGDDHRKTAGNGSKAWLLNFSAGRSDPLAHPGAARYIALGEREALDTRYKTSIRYPWYRVPSVWSGTLLLSKRSHRYPRLVLNHAGILTTDTIYRGNILPLYAGREHDLVSVFHNSLTLLTAEIEGRSFGGGVLELVHPRSHGSCCRSRSH